MKLCCATDCETRSRAGGLCQKHYARLRRTGTLEKRPLKTLAQALDEHSRWEGDCLVWHGERNEAGYGIVMAQSAHRAAYKLLVRDIAKTELLDHMCHNKPCINIKHLRVVTSRQNAENRSGANRKSKTGVRGVSWHKTKGYYVAAAMSGGKTYQRQGFKTIEEAEQAAIALRNAVFTHNIEGVA